MKLQQTVTRRHARIEMVPLIDSMFLLLTYFIYTMVSMSVHRGVKVDLPAASTAELDNREHITISIDKENRVFLNKQPVSVQTLPSLVQEKRAKHPETPVLISGDRRADLGLGIEVLDMLRRNGIQHVSFQAVSRKSLDGEEDAKD